MQGRAYIQLKNCCGLLLYCSNCYHVRYTVHVLYATFKYRSHRANRAFELCLQLVVTAATGGATAAAAAAAAAGGGGGVFAACYIDPPVYM